MWIVRWSLFLTLLHMSTCTMGGVPPRSQYYILPCFSLPPCFSSTSLPPSLAPILPRPYRPSQVTLMTKERTRQQTTQTEAIFGRRDNIEDCITDSLAIDAVASVAHGKLTCVKRLPNGTNW